jgi:hypothetical protein
MIPAGRRIVMGRFKSRLLTADVILMLAFVIGQGFEFA